MKRSWAHAWDKVRDEGACRACGSTDPEKVSNEVIRKLTGPGSRAQHKPSVAPPPKPVAVPAQGWECPRCRTINAPFTPSCRCAA